MTREEHERRRTGIGGSDAGAIVAGGEEWQHLWEVKTGRRQPEDLADVLPVQLGLFTESFNAAWFTKRTGRIVSRRNEFARHPLLPHLFANLDGMTTTANGEPAYIDFKHTGKSGDHLTLRYTAQCTHAAIVTEVDWWLLSVLIGNSRWELVEQEVDPFFAQDYLKKCSEFWSYVQRDEPPSEAVPLPVPEPRKLRTVSLEDDLRAEWPNWAGDMLAHFRKFTDTYGAHAVHEIAKRDIKELMPENVGLVTRGRVKAARDKAGTVRVSLLKGKER